MTIYFISTVLFTLAIGYLWVNSFRAGLRASIEHRWVDSCLMFLMCGMFTIPFFASIAAIFTFI